MTEEVRKTFNKFDGNLISIVFAKANAPTEPSKLEKHWKVHHEILATVDQSDKEFQEGFFNLLVAEYKEYLYKELFDPCFDRIEYAIMCEYGNFLNSTEKYQEILNNHRHDPEHALFRDYKSEYMFYEVVESRDYSIVELSQSEEALYHFNADIICDYCDEFVM